MRMLILALVLCCAALVWGPLGYPPARRDAIVDGIHGVDVADPYRWLEDGTSAETRAWSDAQASLLESFLAGSEDRTAARRRIRELIGDGAYSAPVKAGGRYFYLHLTSSGAGSQLIMSDGRAEAHARPLVDPANESAGHDLAIRTFSPSPNGRLIAYTVSENQSPWLRVHLRSVESGIDVPIAALETHQISAALTWTPDGRALLFNRFERTAEGHVPAAPTRPSVAYFDVARRAVTETIRLDAAPGRVPTEAVTADGRDVVVTLSGGGHKNDVLYRPLASANRRLRPLITGVDATFAFLGSTADRFWFYTTDQAPRGRIVSVERREAVRHRFRDVIPEAPDPIAANSAVGGNAVGFFGNRFVIEYLHDGEPRVRIFHRDGTFEFEYRPPPGGLIWGGLSGSPTDRDVMFQFLGITEMGTVFRLDLDRRRADIFARPATPISPDALELERVFYAARDGTRIPMTIAHRPGFNRDGQSPLFLYGYGAFGWVSFPWYQPFVLAWIEHGGVYALPAIRGGGEYGIAWHEAGRGRQKQIAIDDYVAAAEWLVAQGYTAPSRLVANGGSASASVAAAAIIQRPSLFAAAVIDRPVLDMVRFDRFAQAAYWVPEFGSPRDADDFKALFKWSPYHNLEQGVCYPATLVMSGDRDQVAVPLHAYKFTAALQAAQGCDNPVLLKIMRGAGHNFGATPEQMTDSWADQFAFLSRVLRSTSKSTPTP